MAAHRGPDAAGEPGAPPAVPESGDAQPAPTNTFRGQFRPREDLPDMAGYRLLRTLRGHGQAAGGGAAAAPPQLQHEVAVTSVRFSPDGSRLASAGSDGTAVIWDTTSWEPLHLLKGHLGGISDVAWSPDGRYLATASDDNTLRVWDAGSGACLRILQGHTHYVFCCAFSAGSNLLASGGFDEVVVVWDVQHSRPIKIIPGHSDPVSGVSFSGQPGLDEQIASCSFDGLTRVWHTGTGRCQASLTDAANPALSCVRFSPNGKFLLTATLDSRLLLWDLAARKVKKTYAGHLNQHSCCQATFVTHCPDGQRKYVACGSEDHHVYLWDLQTKQIAGVLRGRPSADAPGDGHCSTVLTVDAAVPRQLIASGGQAGDGSVKIWGAGADAAGHPAAMQA